MNINLTRLSTMVLLCLFYLVGCAAPELAQSSPDPTATITMIPPTATLEPTPVVSPYIGSQTCIECHEEIYAGFQNSGHAWAMVQITGEGLSTPPFTKDLDPPAGFEFTDLAYMIGGYQWQALFVKSNGYLVTAPPAAGAAADFVDENYLNQYNLPNINLGIRPEWTAYRIGEQVDSSTCAACHAPLWSGSKLAPADEALVGVQCEACHGPGRAHSQAPEEVIMSIDRGRDACKRCHLSSGAVSLDPDTGLILHEETYTDLPDSGHADIECVECHDPHTGVRSLRAAGAVTTRQTCESCHPDQVEAQKVVIHIPMNVDCLDCHMPRLIKKASAVVERYSGDVRTHQAAISNNTLEQADPQGQVYPEVGLYYACNHCHAIGSEAVPIGEQYLLDAAFEYHQKTESSILQDQPSDQQ